MSDIPPEVASHFVNADEVDLEILTCEDCSEDHVVLASSIDDLDDSLEEYQEWCIRPQCDENHSWYVCKVCEKRVGGSKTNAAALARHVQSKGHQKKSMEPELKEENEASTSTEAAEESLAEEKSEVQSEAEETPVESEVQPEVQPTEEFTKPLAAVNSEEFQKSIEAMSRQIKDGITDDKAAPPVVKTESTTTTAPSASTTSSTTPASTTTTTTTPATDNKTTPAKTPSPIKASEQPPIVKTPLDATAAFATTSESSQNGGVAETMQQTIQEKAIKAIIDVLKSAPFDLDLMKHGCGFLVRLVRRNNRNMDYIIDYDGVSVTAYGANNHRDDEDLQNYATLLISTLCENALSRKDASLNEVSAILGAMKSLPGNEDVQEKCSDTLVQMTSKDVKATNEATVQFLVDAGGIGVLVATMRDNPDAPKVVAYCCTLFAIIAYNGEVNSKLVAVAGGIDAMISLMSKYIGYGFMQTNALVALRNLLRHMGNVEAIIRANGLEVIIAAMRNHLANAVVQGDGFFVLSKIAGYHDGEYGVRIVDGGAITLATTAMKRHPNDANIHQWACNFFLSLSKSGKAGKDAAIKSGAMVAISETIRLHSEHPDTVKAANEAMQSLLG